MICLCGGNFDGRPTKTKLFACSSSVQTFTCHTGTSITAAGSQFIPPIARRLSVLSRGLARMPTVSICAGPRRRRSQFRFALRRITAFNSSAARCEMHCCCGRRKRWRTCEWRVGGLNSLSARGSLRMLPKHGAYSTTTTRCGRSRQRRISRTPIGKRVACELKNGEWGWEALNTAYSHWNDKIEQQRHEAEFRRTTLKMSFAPRTLLPLRTRSKSEFRRRLAEIPMRRWSFLWN